MPRASARSSVRPASSAGAAVNAASAGSGASARSISQPAERGVHPPRDAVDRVALGHRSYAEATSRRGWRLKPAAMICSSSPEPITGSPSTRSIPSFGISSSRAAVGELGDRLDQLLALELDQAHDPLAAALDVEDRVAVAQQDVGARGARGAPALGALRPRQRGAVGLGRVGGGEEQVLVLGAAAGRAGARPRRRARTGRRRGPRRSSRAGRCRASPGSRARRRARRSRPGRPRRAPSRG